jgi:hypothetical protein
MMTVPRNTCNDRFLISPLVAVRDDQGNAQLIVFQSRCLETVNSMDAENMTDLF